MVGAKLANKQGSDNQHGGSASLQTPISQSDAAAMVKVSTVVRAVAGS
jgi:hypothetical protein